MAREGSDGWQHPGWVRIYSFSFDVWFVILYFISVNAVMDGNIRDACLC